MGMVKCFAEFYMNSEFSISFYFYFYIFTIYLIPYASFNALSVKLFQYTSV